MFHRNVRKLNSKDEAPKDGGSKDEIPKEESSKDEVLNDGGSKDKILKEGSSKDEVPKDGRGSKNEDSKGEMMLAQIIASYSCSGAEIPDSDCANVLSYVRCTDELAVKLYYIFDTLRQFGYLIAKPCLLYLAYQRCCAIPKLTARFLSSGGQSFNYFIIITRLSEWLVWFSIAIYNCAKCQGSYCGPQCEFIPTTFMINDLIATVFRIYYILLELTFYINLFRMNQKNLTPGMRQDIRMQKILFSIDVLQLLAMSTYRIVGLAKKGTPTYLYLELSSLAFTVFVMTRFWHRVMELLIPGNNDPAGNDKPANNNELE
ncbi:23308_t:CDS:2 [Cetraspora pellucida]|uniref:23308_t:CDS:1 n=1 Tax=Cetraspora pellucida TaxID=1433469 RepID=A0A9N8VI91_9GLOM|nr:23308_t:CDS:2 [Cetraspora pellucida]